MRHLAILGAGQTAKKSAVTWWDWEDKYWSLELLRQLENQDPREKRMQKCEPTTSISFSSGCLLIKLCRTRGLEAKQKLGKIANWSLGSFHNATETKMEFRTSHRRLVQKIFPAFISRGQPPAMRVSQSGLTFPETANQYGRGVVPTRMKPSVSWLWEYRVSPLCGEKTPTRAYAMFQIQCQAFMRELYASLRI